VLWVVDFRPGQRPSWQPSRHRPGRPATACCASAARRGPPQRRGEPNG